MTKRLALTLALSLGAIYAVGARGSFGAIGAGAGFGAIGSLVGCGGGSGYVAYEGSVTVRSPELVTVEPDVYVLADADEPVFYTDNYYWLYRSGHWYRSHNYDRDWVYVTTPAPRLRHINEPTAYVRYRSRHEEARSMPRPSQTPVERDYRDYPNTPPNVPYQPTRPGQEPPQSYPLPPRQEPPPQIPPSQRIGPTEVHPHGPPPQVIERHEQKDMDRDRDKHSDEHADKDRDRDRDEHGKKDHDKDKDKKPKKHDH
jgi:hypothetical protein